MCTPRGSVLIYRVCGTDWDSAGETIQPPQENASNVWGTDSAQPSTPILGHFPSELECQAKCAANPNCTQYVWDARKSSLACFGRCDAFWEPHPTPPADGIVSGRRVNVNTTTAAGGIMFR